MLISRVLEVENGDTVGTLRRFMLRLLDEEIADRLFAPVESVEGGFPEPVVIADHETVRHANPLLPVMYENAAIALRDAIKQEPQLTYAAFLRPCEVRAVIELSKRGEIDLNNLVLIGMDCLATYEEAFYHDVNAAHPDDPYWLMHQSLHYAHAGQIAPYRYRTACQFCERPAADIQAVNIQIGLIGVDAAETVLVMAQEREDIRLKLHKLTDRVATEPETVGREITVWRLADRRKKAADRKLAELGLLDANFGAILGYLSKCNMCGECLDSCPLCTESLRTAIKGGRTDFFTALIQESQRLMSCSGCGMCQDCCPEGIPLTAISHALSRSMQAHMHYVPGRSVKETLPWQR
jgi:formate dehydrogenase subunit beta